MKRLKSINGKSKTTDPVKIHQSKQYRQYTYTLRTKCKKIEKHIEDRIKTEGVKFSQSENDDFCCVMEDKSGMHSYPLISKWYTFLGCKSDNDAFKHSKFINLPDDEILDDYTHIIKRGVGFQQQI